MDKTIDPGSLSIAFTNRDLCTRCGTCAGICPAEAIGIGENHFPILDASKCIECGLCGRTCPGAAVSFKKQNQICFHSTEDDPSFDGRVRQTFVGYAADSVLRAHGSGGGVATALAGDLLCHGDIEGCLVTRMVPCEPWRGEGFIARTWEELLSSQGSKYSIIAHNAVLSQIRNCPGRFAYVGLPCQIHGLRLMMEEEPLFRDKISVVIGLFCGGALEVDLIPDLISLKRIAKEELQEFQFRGGDWPGKMRVLKKDGSLVELHQSDYKEGAYNYFAPLYSPMRCLTCIDGSAHFADISIGDVWTRDSRGNYVYRAHSRILVRTERGAEVVLQASRRRSLILEDVSENPHYRTHHMQTRRKSISAPLRIRRLARAGIPVPIYDRLIPRKPDWQDLLAERAATATYRLARIRSLRVLAMSFLTSRWSLPLLWIRCWYKKRKYQR